MESKQINFKCELRIYNPNGNLRFEDKEFKFKAEDAKEYLNREKRIYGRHGLRVEFENIEKC